MSKKRIFILEDDEYRIDAFKRSIDPKHDLIICTSLRGPEGALKKWSEFQDIILLDHDLGGLQFVDSGEEETGYQFAKHMGVAPEHTCHVIVHSYNPMGAKAMGNLLYDNGWRVSLIPFGKSLLDWLEFQ